MISFAILYGVQMGINAGICDCKTNIALSRIVRTSVDSGFHHCLFGW
jgi:hypothetical protein